MNLEKTWVGIDVSQAQLDSYVFPQGLSFAHANNEIGIPALIAQLLPLTPTLVVVESTGGNGGQRAIATVRCKAD